MKASASKTNPNKLIFATAFSTPLMAFSTLLMAFATLLMASPLMAEDNAVGDQVAEDRVLATVNGKAVNESQFIIAASQSKFDYNKITPTQRKQLTDALINRQVVLNEAIKAGFHETPDITSRVKALTESFVAANYLATIAKEFNISDQDIKAYYDKNVIANTAKEFKARHILVKTEDEATTLIKDIEGGADFSKLAKEKSTDTGSGSLGGDLGWFSGKDMVAAFSAKVAGMKKGELSKTPVKSQFGWHVIILDDVRSTKPPELDAIKKDIKQLLTREKLNQYLKDLKAKADVVLK